MIYAATGHRPPRLGLGYDSESNRKLVRFAIERIQSLDAVASLISGMAQGWDMAIAHAAILTGLPFVAALPFEGQDSRWPIEERQRFNAILNRASRVEVVCRESSSKAYILRDHWMVDNADGVLALYDGSPKGGTAETVAYAGKQGRSVINCWREWCGVFTGSTPGVSREASCPRDSA